MKSVEIIRAEERHDWDTNASFYRRDERSPLMRMLAAQRESFYQFRSGQRILDLGCGTGGTVARLRAQGVKAVGVDFSPAMIEAAVAQHGPANHVTCAEATRLPFDPDSFDVVIADGVLHHLAVQGRLVEALSEIRRVLRPGGKLCCFDRNGSLASGVLLTLCIGAKELIRLVTRGNRYASSATRNEIPFGKRKDLDTFRDCGFKLTRCRDAASVPFFLSVVTLNAVQYFCSERFRRFVEWKALPLIAWIDAHCSWHWLSVEQSAVFQLQPSAVCSDATEVYTNPEARMALTTISPTT